MDMIDSEIRILDFKGNLSSFGRVDVRIRGVWGSICNKGANHFTASTICKSLGYGGGKIADKPCNSYQGNNYCGYKLKPIIFKNIKCQENDILIS